MQRRWLRLRGSSRVATMLGMLAMAASVAGGSVGSLPASPSPGLDLSGMAEGVKEFLKGGVANGLGAFSVFPIDLAKTRIQDQRIVAGSEVMYKNVFDTIAKVASKEGIPALYSGVTPVLIGAAPEGAMQIGTNNVVRSKLAEMRGTTIDKLPLSHDMFAGACGGFAQVVVSTPMDRVKILQQVMGKESGSALQIVQQVGLSGLYQGAKACVLRDVFFAALYFPIYYRAKSALLEIGSKNGKKRQENLLDALVAGLAAVITRLHPPPTASLRSPQPISCRF
eukprot:757381-Hanusia_phi.AAC.4